jgi:hypothetical protein
MALVKNKREEKGEKRIENQFTNFLFTLLTARILSFVRNTSSVIIEEAAKRQ